jgi:hypothetical protein
MREASRIPAFGLWVDYLTAWIERRGADMIAKSDRLRGLKIMDDPEAIFQEGWLLCDVGAHEHGLGHLRRAIDKGYSVADTLAHAPAFEALRGTPAFEALLAQAQGARAEALAAFREAGGERLLGI